MDRANDRGDTFDQLRETSIDVRRMAAVLEDLIQHPGTRHDDVIRPSVLVGSSPAWNAQAAYLIFDLRQLVRAHESELRSIGTGVSQRPRGGSDQNTYLALEAIVDLAMAAGTELAKKTLYDLKTWHHRARVVLGEVEPLERVPRQPGEPEPRCPWCEMTTLRYQACAGLVKCVNPECRDEDGERPRGRLEIGRTSGEPLLVWQDSTSGLTA